MQIHSTCIFVFCCTNKLATNCHSHLHSPDLSNPRLQPPSLKTSERVLSEVFLKIMSESLKTLSSAHLSDCRHTVVTTWLHFLSLSQSFSSLCPNSSITRRDVIDQLPHHHHYPFLPHYHLHPSPKYLIRV